jgi:hypothetical protein
MDAKRDFATQTEDSDSSLFLTLKIPKLQIRNAFRLLYRMLLVYLFGYLLSLTILHLQLEHGIIQFPMNTIYQSFFLRGGYAWIPRICGLAAVLVGFGLPWLDIFFSSDEESSSSVSPVKFSRQQQDKGWSTVFRCCGGFIGINYAACVCPTFIWSHSYCQEFNQARKRNCMAFKSFSWD